MRNICRSAAAAAGMALASIAPVAAADGQTAIAFYAAEAPAATMAPTLGAKADVAIRPKAVGDVEKQIGSVSTGCLKPALMAIIHGASSHFGGKAVITSGYRPGRGSFHGRCMAADVQIAGVAPSALARWFRAQPGVGGVGTYGHTRSVHVDIAPRQYSWHHGRRKRYA